LACLFAQRRQTCGVDNAPLIQKINPELRFVGLFFNDAHLRDEFLPRPCSACSAIISPNRRAGPQELKADDIGGAPLWETLN